MSPLVISLGTTVFVVMATLLAALKFSLDLQKATNAQIATLRELSKQEADAAQRTMDESVKSLQQSADRALLAVTDRLDHVVGLLEVLGRATDASVQEAKRLAEEQQKARSAEEERIRREQEKRELEARRRYPRLDITIGERPITLPLIGFIQDFWVAAKVAAPMRTLRVAARSFSSTRTLSGPWLRATRRDLVAPQEIWLLKIGGFGVRGVHDSLEINIEAVNPENERFIASWVWPLQVTDWAAVIFERMG